MEPVDVASTGANKRLVSKKSRGWLRRFHLRKTAGRPPTMQSGDKQGPKTIAEEWQASAARPAARKPPQAAQRRATQDGRPLRFGCSLCRDGAEYLPQDLVGHFEEQHSGIPPVFGCQTCTFSTHELSYLQVHLLSHKDTFSSCALCKDGVQRTWSELRAHLTACHFQNGRYSCQKCRKFSTGDVGVFLEHTYAHSFTLEGAKEAVRAEEEEEEEEEEEGFVLKATARTLRCQHCGYEVSRKLLINDDIQAVHICSREGVRKEGVGPAALKANHPRPKRQLRLTRSAVREMCWLTQDCLALPGREFLDKYCHLSDPQTTLQHTQEFLMKSVAGETADPNWTKALQSVLSNVPQEISLHPKSEKGAVTNSSDLAVLTVENKITVAQNGAAYCKKVKAVTSAEEGAARHQGPGGPNGRREDPGNAPRSQTPGSRKRRGDGIRSSGEPTRAPGCPRAKKRKRRQSVRRKRRVRRKKVDKEAAGLPLKIVLKKNPVKEEQWVSQSCEGGPDGGVGQACPRAAPEEAEVSESCRSRPTEASEHGGPDHREAAPVEPEGPSHPDAGLRLNHCLHADAEAGRRDAGLGSGNTLLRRSGSNGGGVDILTSGNQRSPQADGGTARSGSTASAPSQLAITLQDLGAAVSPEKTEERTRRGEAPADSVPGGGARTASAVQSEPLAVARRRPVPKSTERTLKLVAISPYQPVRRPAGNQPVVVLNHPDADLPEVARVMEVVNRYKGAVRKVALSRRTLDALGGAEEATGGGGDADAGGVQERFLLKLKLRRLGRRKYRVVGGEPAPSFCCWFCGRVFTSQETWVIHRQRHLLEWK